MVSMRSYASIALCILFALLVHADQENGMEGDMQTYMNVQAKGATSREEVSVTVDGKRITGVRKMLVAKKDEGVDVFSLLVVTSDYDPPKQHPPTHKGKNAMKSPGGSDNIFNYQSSNSEEEEEEWKAGETNETGVLNLINEDYKSFPTRPPKHV